MASSPITSWQIDGETMETVTDFIFLSSQITADGDCSHEIKEKKAMTNLDSMLKSKGIALPTKVSLVKAMVFPVVMYGCESWTEKKAHHTEMPYILLKIWSSAVSSTGFEVPAASRKKSSADVKQPWAPSPAVSYVG